MKPVFKCDYCNFVGTQEEVEKHEPTCIDNYDKRAVIFVNTENLRISSNLAAHVVKKFQKVNFLNFAQNISVKSGQTVLLVSLGITCLEGFK